MEECKGKCYRCRFFDRYYTKENIQFKRTACGWCSVKKDNISATGVCERFVPQRNWRVPRKPIVMHLNDLLTEISAMRQLIEDDRCDNDENEEL